MLKKCYVCLEIKEENCFSKSLSAKDGLQCKCKICDNQRLKAYRKTEAGIKTHRKSDRKRVGSEKRLASNRAGQIAFYKRNPEKASQLPARKYVSFVLRFKVFERDNNQCQMCLDKPKKLHCHHIIPAIAAPERITDMSNLITLCKKCHLEAHDGSNNRIDPLWQELALERNMLKERV